MGASASVYPEENPSGSEYASMSENISQMCVYDIYKRPGAYDLYKEILEKGKGNNDYKEWLILEWRKNQCK